MDLAPKRRWSVLLVGTWMVPSRLRRETLFFLARGLLTAVSCESSVATLTAGCRAAIVVFFVAPLRCLRCATVLEQHGRRCYRNMAWIKLLHKKSVARPLFRSVAQIGPRTCEQQRRSSRRKHVCLEDETSFLGHLNKFLTLHPRFRCSCLRFILHAPHLPPGGTYTT